MHQQVMNEELVDASGKMMVFERLLDALFAGGHKVLVFSQFVTMLHVVGDWAHECKGWPLCRIDGSMGLLEHRAEMDRFQKGGNAPDAPRLFLLSTLAGGLGINPPAGDTVVFYNQDWRFSSHTIESKILPRASESEKRQLEALGRRTARLPPREELGANGSVETPRRRWTPVDEDNDALAHMVGEDTSVAL